MNPALLPVLPWLEESRDFGFLGPGELGVHIEQGEAFAVLVDSGPCGHLADLGSGGGVPALILAAVLPDRPMLLIESNLRRAAFLERAVEALSWVERVLVLTERAEVVGRSSWRGLCAVVTARSFGPPAATAECATPLLQIGGLVVVSDPPDQSENRWAPLGGVALGLSSVGRRLGGFNFQLLNKTSACSDRFPRRVGVPAHRPLF